MTTTAHEALYCANHPERQTGLRCRNCGKPICPECVVPTPTGYSCATCVQARQRRFVTAKWHDYLVAPTVAGFLSFIASQLFSFLGGFLVFFTIILAPLAGGLIAEAVRAATGRRRAKLVFQLAAAGVVVGGLLPHFPLVIGVLLGGGFQSLFALLWPGIYLFLATTAVYTRLSGIQLSR